jgi:hypothetical protein
VLELVELMYPTVGTITPRRGSTDRARGTQDGATSTTEVDRKETLMAELTNLEDKLGEVIGLAQAAQNATQKIGKLVEDAELTQTLDRMRSEADQAEERGTQLADAIEGKKTAILDKARETKQKAEEMMKTYLDDEADGLDGFEFLTMAEAGEVGHWKVLLQMAEGSSHATIREFAEWGIPIQERHFEEAQMGTMKLAGEEDPDETS